MVGYDGMETAFLGTLDLVGLVVPLAENLWMLWCCMRVFNSYWLSCSFIILFFPPSRATGWIFRFFSYTHTAFMNVFDISHKV